MPTTIAMIAAVPLTYRGRAMGAGERFEARPIDAAALRYTQRAIFAPRPRVLQTRDLQPEPDAPVSADADMPRTRRQYRRRDLTPEP